MGTHPIFESDFDCLTEWYLAIIQYQIRPSFEEKFKRPEIEEVVRSILDQQLENKEYSDAESQSLVHDITREIIDQLKDLKMSPRFKFIVDVKYGENRGQGVTSVYRALWDSDSDKHQAVNYMNETVFCAVNIFGVYFN